MLLLHDKDQPSYHGHDHWNAQLLLFHIKLAELRWWYVLSSSQQSHKVKFKLPTRSSPAWYDPCRTCLVGPETWSLLGVSRISRLKISTQSVLNGWLHNALMSVPESVLMEALSCSFVPMGTACSTTTSLSFLSAGNRYAHFFNNVCSKHDASRWPRHTYLPKQSS